MKRVKTRAELTWVRFLVALIIGLTGAVLFTLSFQVEGLVAEGLRTLGSALVVAMIVAVTLGLLFETHLLTEIRESQENLLQQVSKTRNNVTTRREHTADPVLQALEKAPLDDEVLTPDDQEALLEGHADLKAGRVVLHEEARHRLRS